MSYYWNIFVDNNASKIKIPSIQLFGGHQVNTSAYYHDPSTRTDQAHFVFQYTLRGEVCFRYGETEYLLGPGECFFCNTHDPKMAYYYPPNAKETYEVLFCVFSGDLAIYEEIVSLYGRIFSLPESSPTIQQFLKYRNRAGNRRRTVNIPVSQSAQMAASLLTKLIELGEKKVPRMNLSLSDKTLIYIAEHIEEKISIEEIAKFVNVSTNHFSRVFKSEVGLAPQKYIDKQRMQHAMKLLKSSTLSIKEVAYRMGFEHPAHFNRSFKRIHGITPGQAKK